MIQCPICQVVNEDAALFCAECGQRFGPAASEPPPQRALQPEPQPEVKAKRVKLHSPMLGGSEAADEEEGYSKPQLSRLRGTSSSSAKPNSAAPPSEGRSTGGRKQLRSPLLGGGDDDFEEEPEEPSSRNRPKKTGGGLRSPLLGESGGYDDDDEPPAPRSQSPGAKKPKLRSPLLGDEEEEEDYPAPPQRSARPKPRPTQDQSERPTRPSSTGGLRSPLLGGGGDDAPPSPSPRSGRTTGGLRSPLLQGGDDFEDDDDEPAPRQSSGRGLPQSGGRQKLHSPMFGNSDAYYDDDDDEDDDGNPDVLRSPLLAAKKKRKEHPPHQGPGQMPGQPAGLPGQMPSATGQQMQGQMSPGAPSPGGMPHPTAYNPTSAPPSGYGAPPAAALGGQPPAVPPQQPPQDLLVASQPQFPPQSNAMGAPGLDYGAPSSISQSGVQRPPSFGAPPAEPSERVKLVHTASRSDVPALPAGAGSEKFDGLDALNKRADDKEEIGPSDRRGRDRRKTGGRDRRLTSPLVDGGRRLDDDDDMDAMPRQKGGVPVLVPILIIFGLLCKGLFFQQVAPTNTLGALPWYFWVDQGGTGVALVLCLIIVVMSGGKK